MHNFQVFYAKNPSFGFGKVEIDLQNIEATHTFVRQIETDDLKEVFHQMQGEIWSPNGEARELIQSLGLKHTSMSAGDLALDCTTGILWLCASFGWKEMGGAKKIES